MLKKVLLATVAVGFTAACAGPWDVERVEALPAPASAFESALKTEYQAQAAMEREEADWADTAYFLRKATEAANGQTVLPTTVDERDLSNATASAALADVTAARAALVAVLDGGARTRAPAVAARAQAAGFDCWVQELEEGHQPADIAACKAVLDAAMAELTAVKVVEPAPAVMADKFVVTFATGAFNLDGTARKTLTDAVEAFKANKTATVVVAGHTDTVGSTNSNITLSQKRAEVVANELARLGVAPTAMALEAYGEEQLLVPTPDATPEVRNRRVEITLRNGAQ